MFHNFSELLYKIIFKLVYSIGVYGIVEYDVSFKIEKKIWKNYCTGNIINIYMIAFISSVESKLLGHTKLYLAQKGVRISRTKLISPYILYTYVKKYSFLHCII